MKKIISLLTLILTAICVNAQESVYLQDCTVQAGSKAVIKVIVAHDTSKGCIGSMQFNYSFDDGIVVRDNNQDVVGVGATTVNDQTNFVLLGGMESTTSAAPDGACVCVFNIDIPADMTLGEHPMSISNIMAVYEDGITAFELDQVESTMTVQKSAVIEPLTDGYSLEVLPFVAKEGNSTIDVLFKSAATAKSVTFDIELPQGMMFYDENFAPSKAVLNASACYNTPTTTLTITDVDNANKASVSVMGQNTGAAALRKYINQLDELTTLVSIPVYVVPADEIADWGDEYALNEGVYEVKLNNIVVTDYVSNATFTGNYIASVIVGQPSAQEAILYGNYNEATASAFTTALKNVAIADVTAATVDDGAKFTDVLVNEKGGNSYYTRTSANYGTTVLPLDLTKGANVDELYMIESMDSESIVLTEAENVPANTPCIFKGTINVEGATPTLGVPSEQGLGMTTFKGTYEATEIAEGAGYYISSNGKFYGDGATVRPFRGYFDGTIAGVKSLRVLLDDATGLIDITDQFSKEDIYNLQGIRMNNVQKGINIKGGKKVLVK